MRIMTNTASTEIPRWKPSTPSSDSTWCLIALRTCPLAVIEVGGHKERDDHLDERRDTLLIPRHGLPPMMAMPQGWHSGVASASARPSDAGLRLRSSDEGQ
jgi:hypothetical protein